MTSPNEYDQDYQASAPETHPAMRLMPPPPSGGAPAVDLVTSAQLGAALAAQKVTSAQVTRLLHVLQTLSMDVMVQGIPKVAQVMQEGAANRLEEAIQRVRYLPVVTMPVYQPGLRGMLSGQPMPAAPDAPVYVQVKDVINILETLKRETMQP